MVSGNGRDAKLIDNRISTQPMVSARDMLRDDEIGPQTKKLSMLMSVSGHTCDS